MGGAEKSLLIVGGQSIAERTVGILARLCSGIVVATPRPEPWRSQPVRIVDDEVPEGGPLAGLASGLAASPTAWVLAVGGDMPLLDESLLAGLCERALATGRAVIPRHDGIPQPLHAVYRARDAATARAALAAGARKALACVDPADVEWVDVSGPRAASFLGVNTPAELEALRGRAVPAASRRTSRSRT